MLDLNKGMSLDLTKTVETLTTVDVGVNWGKIEKKRVETITKGAFLGMFGGTTEIKETVVSRKSVDLDLSAILYDDNGNHVQTVYFGNLSSNGIKHSGDDRSGDDEDDGKDNEVISIKFSDVQPKVSKIAIVLVSFNGQPFGELPYAGVRIYDTNKGKKLIAQTNVAMSSDESKFSDKVSMVFGILHKSGSSWEYKSIVEPTNMNKLEQLVTEAKKYL